MRKILPFEKTLPYQNRLQGGRRYYYTAKSNNRDQNKNARFQTNMSASARKFHHVGSASNGKYVFYHSKGSSCHQEFRTGFTNKDCNSRACASSNKKIIYKKHSKYAISKKTSLLFTREKITQDQEILSIVKGYEIPFVSLPSQEKLPNLTEISK